MPPDPKQPPSRSSLKPSKFVTFQQIGEGSFLQPVEVETFAV